MLNIFIDDIFHIIIDYLWICDIKNLFKSSKLLKSLVMTHKIYKHIKKFKKFNYYKFNYFIIDRMLSTNEITTILKLNDKKDQKYLLSFFLQYKNLDDTEDIIKKYNINKEIILKKSSRYNKFEIYKNYFNNKIEDYKHILKFIRFDNVDAIKYLLPFIKPYYYSQMLYYASEICKINTIKFILENSRKYISDEDLSSSLFLVVSYGNSNCVKYLIKQNVLIDEDVMVASCERGNSKILKCLLKQLKNQSQNFTIMEVKDFLLKIVYCGKPKTLKLIFKNENFLQINNIILADTKNKFLKMACRNAVKGLDEKTGTFFLLYNKYVKLKGELKLTEQEKLVRIAIKWGNLEIVQYFSTLNIDLKDDKWLKLPKMMGSTKMTNYLMSLR